MDTQAAAEQMAQALAMYPQMKDVIGRARVEGAEGGRHADFDDGEH